jgi:hypothetical protein
VLKISKGQLAINLNAQHTVATFNIGPYLNLTELSGNFRKLTLLFNSSFVEVKIDQCSEIGNIPCIKLHGEFDRHKITFFLMHGEVDRLILNLIILGPALNVATVAAFERIKFDGKFPKSVFFKPFRQSSEGEISVLWIVIGP